MKKCPYCAEEIQDAAIVCRYCGRDLPTDAKTPVQVPEWRQVEKSRQQQPGCLTIYFTNVLRRFVWLFIIGGIMYVWSWVDSYRTPSPTPAPTRTRTPIPTRTPILSPTQVSNLVSRFSSTEEPGCYSWEEVTPDLEDQFICVYGTVYDAAVTSIGGGQFRIYFSENDSDLFLLDVNYTYPDVKEGVCVAAEGYVETDMRGVPYINLQGHLKDCSP